MGLTLLLRLKFSGHSDLLSDSHVTHKGQREPALGHLLKLLEERSSLSTGVKILILKPRAAGVHMVMWERACLGTKSTEKNGAGGRKEERVSSPDEKHLRTWTQPSQKTNPILFFLVIRANKYPWKLTPV